MSSSELSLELQSSSPEQTHDLGVRMGCVLSGGLTIALIGPLGAGKTHLVKGIAAGNGTTEPRKVTSPTFTLIQEYTGRWTVHHLDAYRLRGPKELLALGFEELVDSNSVVIVEWADKVAQVLPQDLLTIRIDPMPPTGRLLSLSAVGTVAQKFMTALHTTKG